MCARSIQSFGRSRRCAPTDTLVLPIALEMRNISKSFGSIQANKNVSLEVYHGEILAILGENGCGKTTLMNMIAGIYFPDEGTVLVDGKEVVITSPKDPFDHKSGMGHQPFKLASWVRAPLA